MDLSTIAVDKRPNGPKYERVNRVHGTLSFCFEILSKQLKYYDLFHFVIHLTILERIL